MSLFTGSCVALVTPFTERGVNFDAFDKSIDFQIEQGTDALLACGTTGEPSTMTQQEKRDVIRFTVEKSGGRLPVIAGIGGNNTAEVVRAAIEAEELGADGLLAVNPYYNKGNVKGILAHFRAISKAVSLPIIVYNVPSRTNVNITPKILRELAKLKNVRAVKEASGNIAQVLEIFRTCGDVLDIYSGNDDMVVPLLASGGKGVISVVANVAPADTHLMVEEFLKGNIQRSLELQLKLLPLIDALFCEVNPIPVKTAMNLMGFNMGPLRLPLADMEDTNLALLKKAMKEYGLIA
jgi:4-hydroxy-tetrahydrodipicolinate synthase